ncbi:MAG: GNAT family N-acetyltransferase [Pseudomonadota bacterium]
MSDAPRLRAIAAAAFGPFTAQIGRAPAPMSMDFEAAIAAGHALVAHGESEGALFGYAICYRDSDRPSALHINSVAVDPAAQGGGIGRGLIAACEEMAHAGGFRLVTLYTNEAMTGALALYPRLGYREIHRGLELGFRRVYFEKTLRAEEGA